MSIITTLSAPPSRSAAPANYVTNMDAWLAALPTMVNEINALTASDWFSVQSSATDTTAGTIALQGNDASYDDLSLSGILKMTGASNSVIQRTDTAGVQYMFGGTGAADGAGISLFGSTQATNPNLMVLEGDTIQVRKVDNTMHFSIDSSGNIAAGTDNAQTLGTAAKRWSVVYAGTGTINTSDVNAKTEITGLDAAEKAVAVAAKGLLKKFKFNDAIAAKGSDGARWHFGIIAQELAAAFEAEGLDPWRYGVMCRDEWWEADVTVPAVYEERTTVPAKFDEEGNLLTEPVTEQVLIEPERIEHRVFDTAAEAPAGAEYVEQYGVRYDELFAFILASI